jgi:hypothetical protein
VPRVALLVALVLSFVAGPAHAYVRSTTTGGNAPLYWKEGCVPVTVYVNGFDTAMKALDMSVDKIAKSVAAAAHTWSADGVSCADGSVPYLEIVPTLSLAKTPAPAAYDARNSLIFRTDNWTQSGKPDGKAYAFEALAVTTVISRLDGHIVDADMEINGLNHYWMNLDPGVVVTVGGGNIDVDVYDLQNTLTHEFGHLIGLDHTCYRYDPASPTKLRPKDNAGKDVPDCVDAPASVMNTVMFDSAVAGETSKRVLSADDSLAVCEIYSASLEHEACALDTASVGCAIEPVPLVRRPVRAPALVALSGGVGLALVAWRRRRARRR